MSPPALSAAEPKNNVLTPATVIVRYELRSGTVEIVGKKFRASVLKVLADDAVEEAVKKATSGVLGVEQDRLQTDASFMDLGADSLDITEIAAQVAEATGGKRPVGID